MSAILVLLLPLVSFADCNWSLNDVKVSWTGYKLTEKAAVKGSFDQVQVIVPSTATSLEEAIDGAAFVIHSHSVNSGAPERDKNLRETYFKILKTPFIKGFVESVKGSEAVVMLSLNGVTKPVPFKWVHEKNMVKATATIDVVQFLMEKSVQQLNQRCLEQHKGKDGVSKTWSEVGLEISAVTTKNCGKK